MKWNLGPTRLLPAVLTAFLSASVTPAPAQPAPVNLKWAPCGDVAATECATLEVPIDHANRDGAKFTLRVGRIPTVNPASRRGVLLIIPGGPGAGIAEELGAMRSEQHLPEFAQHYDVVSFDPRGIGGSNPIRCDPALAPKATMPLDRKATASEFDAVAKANHAFAESCAKATGELFWHLSARDTAGDVERIRQVLTPGEGIVAYAASYGSEYGAAYLEAYPKNVKALILDAVMDHGVDYATFTARNVLAVQDGFERMVQWCRRDAKCALHGKDFGAAFDAAIARAPKMRTLVPQMLAGGDDPQLGWPVAAQLVAEVSSGDMITLKEIEGALALSTNRDEWLKVGKDGLFRGVICSDYGPQRNFTELARTGDMLAGAAPRFLWKYWNSSPMENASAGVGVCVGWPRDARNPPHTLDVGPHPNVMVLNTTHDPPTPLANALSIWLQIPRARLAIADVDGHQALVLSKCAYEASARFLADPTSVESVTLCP